MWETTKSGQEILLNFSERNKLNRIMEAIKKIRVVWICSVSNPMIREHLELGRPWWMKIIARCMRRGKSVNVYDSAQWNTNALNEFEKINDVELHVIFTHPWMKHWEQRFEHENIRYYAVNEGQKSLLCLLRNEMSKAEPHYEKSWEKIAYIVKEINPEIIHVMGAENPTYSLALLYISPNIPSIVQLQTLLINPLVKQSYNNLGKQEYCEAKVLKRADYIGSKSAMFPRMIREEIGENYVFVNSRLLISEETDKSDVKKEYDFVYFSNFLNKAIDLVIEAFGIAHKRNPNVTLDIIGGATNEEIEKVKKRAEELGCLESINFEGKLPTHDDVKYQIKKSRFALLPLKSDLISGTIREAIAAGLPVITTITQATPTLNEKRESVLLSETGNHESLANNMLRLINEPELAEQLKVNATITSNEKYGTNASRAKEWVDVYKACIDNFYNNIPLPDNILNKN